MRRSLAIHPYIEKERLIKIVCKTYEKLGTKRGTALKLGLPETTVRRWVDKYIPEEDQSDCDGMKILLIDLETSPNVAHVWGLWNQNVGLTQLLDSSYTMCFTAKWLHKEEIIFFSVYHDGEKKMLQKLWDLLDRADAVVHFNGKKFDIPTCNKEFLLKNIHPPSAYHQIDLLKVAKDRFRFPSNKLDYISQALGIGQKVKHIGHELWIRCMAGDDEAWKNMKEYNIHDVVLLEKVYKRMLPWIKNHPNHGLYTDEDRPVCPNCGSHAVNKKGTETTLTLTYVRYKCTSCGTPIRGRYTIDTKEKRKNILTQSKL